MSKPVFANGREIAHKGNGGLSVASPNVCLTQVPIPPPGMVPIPYSSIAKSKDVSEGPNTVKIGGKMPLVKGGLIGKTTGDKPGKSGIMSGCTGGPAELMIASFDVKIEGQGAGRLGDSLFHNKRNAMK